MLPSCLWKSPVRAALSASLARDCLEAMSSWACACVAARHESPCRLEKLVVVCACLDELRELSPTGGGSATCVDLSGRPQGSYDSAVSPHSRSAFGPVPLSRSDAHGIGRGGHYQGRHLLFHQGPATHTPRDERTELVSFHRSAKAPHAPPIQPGAQSGYFLASLSVGVGRPTCRTRDPAGVEVCAC